MAPTAAPPLVPPVRNPAPAVHSAAAPMAPPAHFAAAAMAPSAEPPRAAPLANAMPPMHAPPAVPTPPTLQATPSISDELASLALKCAVADEPLRVHTGAAHPNLFHPSELWGGAYSPGPKAWPESGGLENGSLDSPGASPGTPGIGKRDVSFSQVVKRAISFLDAIDDRGSPMHD